MIVHLSLSTPEELLQDTLLCFHGSCYHRNKEHYVLVLGAEQKTLPEALKPHAVSAVATETNMQLSTRVHHKENTEIAFDQQTRIHDKSTWIAAGPCSVESEEQLEEIARFLQGLGIRFFRAGAYKPRTSPYSFQGLGAEGLRMLAALRKRYGFFIITEARDSTQIDEVLEHTDIVQIGTKAMYDQGILRACGQARKPVLLKRGFGSTLQEFLQASEFILSAGNEQVILCERGIRSFEPRTRFSLDLCGVAYLKKHSHLPIFVDPSHAMGHAYGVPDLARAATAMGVEGLLIEIHPRPTEALSDASQQLDFKHFSALHASLVPVAAAVGRQIG